MRRASCVLRRRSRSAPDRCGEVVLALTKPPWNGRSPRQTWTRIVGLSRKTPRKVRLYRNTGLTCAAAPKSAQVEVLGTSPMRPILRAGLIGAQRRGTAAALALTTPGPGSSSTTSSNKQPSPPPPAGAFYASGATRCSTPMAAFASCLIVRAGARRWCASRGDRKCAFRFP